MLFLVSAVLVLFVMFLSEELFFEKELTGLSFIFTFY